MDTTARDSSYGWVIVAAGALLSCVALGAMFSLPVLLNPMATATGWSRAGISSAMTLNFIIMGLGAFGWGAACDRWGTRPVVLIGVGLLGLALVLASRATSLLAFQLSYGVLVGLAASAFFGPLMAATTRWFDRNRSLAVSLVSAGMGVAPMTVSPFVGWLASAHDWRFAMLVIGIASWVLLLPTAFLIREPPAVAAGAVGAPAGPTRAEFARVVRTPQFIVLALTFAACCTAHSGPIFHMVSYAMLCGIAPLAAVSIYSVEGLAGLGGRLLLGVLGDRYGAKPVLIAGLAVQAIAIAAYVLVNRLGEFYALAVIFGMAYGGVMPLYAVLARDYFGPRIIGTVLGAITMLSSLGMAAGPWIGGWLYDNFNAYTWLFIGSALVGLGAVAAALVLPRGPRAPEAQPA